MKQWMCLIALAVMTSAADAQPSQPALSYEMTVDGLSEKVTLVLHSWSWGASVEDDTDELGADGKPRAPRGVYIQDFHIVIEQSATSALLLDALAAKKLLSKVVMRAKEPGSDKVFELAMKDVKITSFQSGGSGYGGGPMEQVSMTFKTAKMTVGTKGKTQSADVTRSR